MNHAVVGSDHPTPTCLSSFHVNILTATLTGQLREAAQERLPETTNTPSPVIQATIPRPEALKVLRH